MPGFEWERLLELAPLALMKPGSPQGAAMLQGYQQALQQRQQQQIQRQQQAMQERQFQRQDELTQAQMANMQAGSARADESQAMQRQQQALQRLTQAVGAFSPAIERVAETATDPVQAENALMQRSGAIESAFGLEPSQLSGFIPPMAPLVSARKKKRAEALYAQAEKTYGPEAMASDAITLQTGELFGDVKPSQLRALFSTPAVTDGGQAAPPYVKPPAFAGTKTERARELLEKIDDATAAGNTPAVARFRRQYDNLLKAEREVGQAGYHAPREPSGRTLESAREAAYQALLAGGSPTASARALRQAGLDPEVELNRIRRQIEDDVRALEARLPVDTDMGENRADPTVYQKRLDRARSALRASAMPGGSDMATPPPGAAAPSSETVTQAELRAVARQLGISEADAARQAQSRGLTVVP